MDINHKWNISVRPLIHGVVYSVVLIYLSFYFAQDSILSTWAHILTALGLATVQAFVQLITFMHLGIEEKPRWNLLIFAFLVGVIAILVGLSLWIMYNLGYNAGP